MFDVSLAPQRFGNGMDWQIASLWPMQIALASSCTLVNSSCQARRDAVRRIAILVTTCKSRRLAGESILFARMQSHILALFLPLFLELKRTVNAERRPWSVPCLMPLG